LQSKNRQLPTGSAAMQALSAFAGVAPDAGRGLPEGLVAQQAPDLAHVFPRGRLLPAETDLSATG
jgi:hypothetical protein